MATQVVAEKVIRVDVVTSAAAQRNIKLLAEGVAQVEKNTASMKNSLTAGFGSIGNVISGITSAFAALGVGTGLAAITKQVLDAASAYQVLESRLKLVLGTQEAGNRATREVVDIAVRTGREVDGVAKLYEKAARSAQQFGISQDDVRKITLGFSESIRLSGASTQEAYASLVQFGQALASGRLQGDEFRSLMENNSVFMYEFAKAAGVTVSQLRKMGTEGKLNAQFLFDTMLKKGQDGITMLDRLAEQARQMPLTFQQSLNSLGTQTTALIGELSGALALVSNDPLGLFGPIIRSFRTLTEAIRDAREESNSMNEGVLARLLRTLRGAGSGLDKDSFLSNLPFGIGAATRVFGTSAEERGEVARLKRIQEDTSRLQEQLNAVDATIVKLETKNDRTTDDNARLERLKKQAEELTAGIQNLNKIREGTENYDSAVLGRNAKSAPAKTGPSDEEIKRLKKAQEAFKDYVEKLREERDAVLALQEGRAESLRQGKQDETLKRLAAEAGYKLTDSSVRYASALTREIAVRKENLTLQQKFNKDREEAIQKNGEYNAKIQETIDRDQAAIEALQNKSKATQEFSTKRMEDELMQLEIERGFNIGSPFQKNIEDTITLLETAIAKRRELEGVQNFTANQKLENKINNKDEREILQESEQLVGNITRGLAETFRRGSKVGIGDQLWENIQDTFRQKVIELTFKPILDPVAQALTRLAEKFAEELAIKAALSFNTSSIGSLLARLIGTADPSIGPPAPTGAVGIERVPYDGFMVALHRGERVQTAKEANEYRQARADGRTVSGVSVNPTYVINIDSRSDAEAIAADTRRAIAQGNQDLVEELRSRGVLS